jgi:hypothetical protein
MASAVLEGYRQLQNIAAKRRLDPGETFDEILRPAFVTGTI